MSTFSGENLRPSMTLDEVGKIAGGASIFKVTQVAHVGEAGQYCRRSVEAGEGVMFGVTLTEPPFKWSIVAKRGLQRFELRQRLTVRELQSADMDDGTFCLEAKN